MAYTTEQIEEIKNKILNALEEVIDPEQFRSCLRDPF